MDEQLGARAAREGTSKAELIRRFVAEKLDNPRAHDPLDDIIGLVDDEPGPIDELIYGS